MSDDRASRQPPALALRTLLMLLLGAIAGALAGSDSDLTPVRMLYWASGGSVLFLSVYRILMASSRRAAAPAGSPLA